MRADVVSSEKPLDCRESESVRITSDKKLHEIVFARLGAMFRRSMFASIELS
jgi:hypothetical protein